MRYNTTWSITLPVLYHNMLDSLQHAIQLDIYARNCRFNTDCPRHMWHYCATIVYVIKMMTYLCQPGPLCLPDL